MTKISALVVAILALSGCATQRFNDSYSLQYPNTSSTLYFAEDLPQLPGHGVYLEVPGYIFVSGQISLYPGKHKISYACPGDWEWRLLTHYVPSVEQRFELGKSYELYCENGYPHIRAIKDRD